MGQSTYPPLQCAGEEITADVLPQLVPNDFESVGVRFAHAPSDTSSLFRPEITFEYPEGTINQSVWVALTSQSEEEVEISYSLVVLLDQNKEQSHR